MVVPGFCLAAPSDAVVESPRDGACCRHRRDLCGLVFRDLRYRRSPARGIRDGLPRLLVLCSTARSIVLRFEKQDAKVARSVSQRLGEIAGRTWVWMSRVHQEVRTGFHHGVGHNDCGK